MGVCLERSAELIVSLLAIWKAGGAYLPLDPEYPAERLAFMLDDAGAGVVLATVDTAAALHGEVPAQHHGWISDQGSFHTGVASRGARSVRLVLMDGLATTAPIDSLSDGPIRDTECNAPLTPQSLAYVIYTSGSTGNPKGVMVGHDPLNAFRAALQADVSLGETDTILAAAPVTFDVSFQDFILGLSAAARIELMDRSRSNEPGYVAYAVDRARASYLHLAPASWRQALANGWQPGSDLQVITGAEPLDTSLLDRMAAGGATVWNSYGPTETTVTTTTIELEDHEDPPPIGAPVANTQVYVLDGRFEPVPVGVAGELLIGGLQVSRGYLGRPGLTAEKFVADPFSGEPGARLYRTGDLARWRPDGSLEFLGRMDAQVKIRGMRVELGEIEAALSGCDGVAQAVVAAPKDETGDTRLVAYVVPAALSDTHLADALSVTVDALTDADRHTTHTLPLAGLVDLNAIRTALKRMLPEHMVPSGFVGLSRVPLTPSGKVDRKALPEAEAAVVSVTYATPRSEREALMCTIMRDVIAHDRLSLERVGIDDQFFDIGGHSIFAAQFAMRLEKALGEPVPVRLIFEAPTVRALSARLHERFEANRPAVMLVDRTQPIPASFEQERMWLANRIHGERSVYNEGLPLLLRGQVNTQALVTAVQGTLDRYETLRTRLVWQDDRLIQEIDPEGALKVTFEDWSDRPGSAEVLEEAAQERARTLLSAPYDLATEHPCRALVLKLSDEAHVWVLATHHAVGDNWSLSHVMPAVFSALYDAACDGRATDLPSIALHYADYAAWQRSAAMAPILEEQLGYWRKTLSGAPEVLDLPSDRPRPAVREHHGGRLAGEGLSADAWRAVERFAVAHDGTPFMVFVAGLSALLSRVSGTSDIVIGTPHVMKPDAGLWEEFGYFGNTLALRTEVDPLQSFADHFAKVRQTVLSAFAHQDLPFEAVAKELGVLPANATPVFQVMLVMHAFLDEGAFVRDDFAIEALGVQPEVAKTDLSFGVNPGADGVRLSLEYATDIFDPGTMERLSAMLLRLLGAAVEAPETLVADLPLMDKAERHQVVALFNDTAVDYPQDQTVVDLFCARATERPDAVAVVDGERTLTYGALDAASNRLARHLISLGVGPEVVVGVCLERSAELIVSLLAIWKAGGAYLPLDPQYPEERLAFMLQAGNSELAIINSATVAYFSCRTARTITIDSDTLHADLTEYSTRTIVGHEHSGSLISDNLSVLLYTSGSTGRPKPAGLTYKSLAHCIVQAIRLRSIQSDTRLLSSSALLFDGSLFEWLPALSAGSALILAGSGAIPPIKIQQIIRKHSVNNLNLIPQILVVMDEASFQVDVICTGGDVCSSEVVNKFSNRSNLIHTYGPTETTIFVTATKLFSGMAVSLGSPVNNTQLYVMDCRLKPVPLGVAGELLIGGLQVSRGYLGRPGLTAEKFIADPFSGEAGARLY
ncbi:MAG: amino acid adenylation domain-containing protein, partial [Pseudomonadota bacterium]